MRHCDVQVPDRTLRWSLQWCLTVPLSLNNDSLIGQGAVVIQSTKIVFMASTVITVILLVNVIVAALAVVVVVLVVVVIVCKYF